jgi:hypothetical protein
MGAEKGICYGHEVPFRGIAGNEALEFRID